MPDAGPTTPCSNYPGADPKQKCGRPAGWPAGRPANRPVVGAVGMLGEAIGCRSSLGAVGTEGPPGEQKGYLVTERPGKPNQPATVSLRADASLTQPRIANRRASLPTCNYLRRIAPTKRGPSSKFITAEWPGCQDVQRCVDTILVCNKSTDSAAWASCSAARTSRFAAREFTLASGCYGDARISFMPERNFI